ncbi:MAG: hypothetical protein ABI461_04015, partial [Polyangiaceae bacterium]
MRVKFHLPYVISPALWCCKRATLGALSPAVHASRYICGVIFGSPAHAAPNIDDDIDLPPMDGATDEAATDESDSDDLDPVPADAGKDALDDSTGSEDPVDLEEIDPLDGESLVTNAERDRAEDLDEDAEFLEDRGSDPALESESMLS